MIYMDRKPWWGRHPGTKEREKGWALEGICGTDIRPRAFLILEDS